ncbi:NUDIX hydrolase [Streptomyces sp. NPDC017993]|uniref:NUDIX hydrolase n=1 Tax=Streptomyces sp. NPDC017993 TaxID=3365027 RepID=UPI0037B2ACCF
MTLTLGTDLTNELIAAADRDSITKYVVGAAIHDPEGRVLIMRRAAGDFMGGLWELPSGSVDRGEGLLEALHREVKEETGLQLVTVESYLGHFDYTSGSGKRARQFTFAATANVATTVRLSPDEHDAYLWADETEQNRVSEDVRTVLGTWKIRAGRPGRHLQA